MIRARGSRRSGVTVLEVAVASTIVVVVLGVATAGMMRAVASRRGTFVRADVARRAEAGLVSVVGRLEDCGGSAVTTPLAPPEGSPSITYREKRGWSDGAISWGPLTTLRWESDPDDPENGRDDDDDGLVDEGVVAWETGSGPDLRRVVLVRNVACALHGEVPGNGRDDNANGLVDERGLSFDRVQSRLNVRLTIERIDGDGILVSDTAETAVRLSD